MNRNNYIILSILLSVMILFERGYGYRILGILPVAVKSHFVLFEQTMKSLSDRGHNVHVVSLFPQEKSYPNYTDISIAESVPKVVNSISYETLLRFSKSSAKEFIDIKGNDVCALLELPQLQELIKNPPNDPPYDLLVVELFYANCYLAFGRHLNIPVVALTSSPMLSYTNEPLGNPLNTAYVSEIGEGSVSLMNFWQRLKNTIMTWKMCFESRYHTEIQDEMVKKHFGPEMPGIRQLEREISLLLVNSHHTLNGIRPTTPAVVEVGGLHIREDDTEIDEELESWLNDSVTGFIYFTFGAVVPIESFPEELLLEFYTAFSKLAPLRVLMKVNEPKYLPPGLPANVITFAWIPQLEILKHENLKGMITHGGSMGIQEAAVFGIPFVGIPLFHDQQNNVKNCVDRGAALQLDYNNLDSDKIAKAVNEIVHNPKYTANMMELSARFLDRPIDAKETAVYWIEFIIKHGRNSLRSPAVYLTWWQVALLDVYGSIIIVIFVILYLLKRLINFLINKFCRVKNKTDSLKKKKKN